MNFFKKLFSDDNNINEKAIIGFTSFIILTIFAIADIVTGYVGKDLVINETIFNAFLIMTLGSFGIASIDKYINKKASGDSDSEDNVNTEK